MQTLSELVLAKVLNPDTFRWVSCSCPWPLWCSAPEKSPSGKILASPQFESNNFRISDDDWSGGAWQEQVGACWGGIWHFAEWVNCCLTVWFLIFLGIRVIFCFLSRFWILFVCVQAKRGDVVSGERAALLQERNFLKTNLLKKLLKTEASHIWLTRSIFWSGTEVDPTLLKWPQPREVLTQLGRWESWVLLNTDRYSNINQGLIGLEDI